MLRGLRKSVLDEKVNFIIQMGSITFYQLLYFSYLESLAMFIC